MRDTIADFYERMNRGDWEGLKAILSENVRMRSNYLYSADRVKYEIGGNILGRENVLEFIKKRQGADNPYWDYSAEKVFGPNGVYFCSFAHPKSRSAGCNSVISCTFEQEFVHVFWFQTTDAGEELQIPVIGDITEVDLMKVGTN